MNSLCFRHRRGQFDLTSRGLIMGILNATPDSFSDGGRFLAVEAATQQAVQQVAEGAQILDIGGESTRPGATPVAEAEELQRVLPVITSIRQVLPEVVLSIDTMKPAVAEAALQVGADIINDVTGFELPAMREVAAKYGAGCVVMHMQGRPKTMQQAPSYEDVTAEVRDFFQQRLRELLNAGVSHEQVLLDPGIGFGKTVEHNLTLLRALPDLSPGPPIMLGVSRKSFLGKILGDPTLARRSWPTVALTSYGRHQGVRVFRVHEVRANHEALHMSEAILLKTYPAK
jgi:dihydropteroate synthase